MNNSHICSIIAKYDIESLESKITDFPNYNRTQSGYGRKLPTHQMVRLPGSKVWRRVYCCIYSNIGTCYVTTKNSGDWIVIY